MNAPNATVLAAVMTNRPSPPAVQAGVCGSRACGWRGMGARVQRAVGLAASAREAGMPRPLCLRSADALRGRRVELERSPRSVGQARKEDLLSQGPAPCRIAAHAPESAVTREYVDPLSIPPCWGGGEIFTSSRTFMVPFAASGGGHGVCGDRHQQQQQGTAGSTVDQSARRNFRARLGGAEGAEHRDRCRPAGPEGRIDTRRR
jgi:hypothetical protein